MRPTTLFWFLTALSCLAGGGIYSHHREELLRLEMNERLADLTPAAAPEIGPEDSAEAWKKKSSFWEEQFKLQKKTNDELQAAIGKLEAQLNAKPAVTGAPAAPAEVRPAGNLLDAMVRDLEDMRQLRFRTRPTFVKVPIAEIEKRHREVIAAQIAPEQAGARVRAARVMGFAADRFDFLDAWLGLTLEQSGGFFDAAKNEMLVDQEADFASRPDLRARLIKELAVALLKQNFPAANGPEINPSNDDQAAALRSAVIGDATISKIHYGVVDAINNDASTAPTVSATPFTRAPVFLREQFLLPYMMATTFSQAIQQEGDAPALNKVFSRMPQATTEVLHPDLYLATPPFSGEPLGFSASKVGETTAFFENTCGEFSILSLLKTKIPEDAAFTAAEGWKADRYLCFPGDERNGDQFVWITRWAAAGDAREFLDAIRQVLLHRYTIPYNKRYEQPDGSFIVNDPYRILRFRLTPDQRGVTVVNAVQEAFANLAETTQLDR